MCSPRLTTYSLMKQKLDEARIREQQTQNEVSLKTIDPAYSVPFGNKQVLKLILALILSPILGIGVAFLLYYTDNTVKTASEAEKLLGLPVLCAVPNPGRTRSAGSAVPRLSMLPTRC